MSAPARFQPGLVLLALLLAAAIPLPAFDLTGRTWPNGDIPLTLALGTAPQPFIDRSSDFDAIAESALADWNQHLERSRFTSVRNADGVLAVTLSTPKELGGAGGPGTNPEQLFAAGYSACFLGALKFVAGKAKVQIPADTKVSAQVGIGPRDDGTGFGIEVALTISIPG